MWLFDSASFTSVVAYDPAKDRAKKSKHREVAVASVDPMGWLLVRGRIREDLEGVGTQLGVDVFVDNDTSADYSYRALVSRDDWKRYLSLQVDKIDYDAHFKEVVQARSLPASQRSARYSAMMSCWSAMARLQDTIPYSGCERDLDTPYGRDGSRHGTDYVRSYEQGSMGSPWDPPTARAGLSEDGEEAHRP